MNKQTEHLIEKISDASYVLGCIDKMYFLSNEIMKASKEYFSQGKDDLAIAYRETSNKIKEQADALKNKYDQKERVESSNAWSILSNCVMEEVYPE